MRDESSRGRPFARKTTTQNLPVIVGAALSRALSYGEARTVAASFGCSEGHLSRIKNGERRLWADELPALANAMPVSTRAVFLGVIAEACGFEVMPAATAGSGCLLHLRTAVGAALGMFDGALAEHAADGEIDRQEAGELVDELEAVVPRIGELLALLKDVRDERQGALGVGSARKAAPIRSVAP